MRSTNWLKLTLRVLHWNTTDYLQLYVQTREPGHDEIELFAIFQNYYHHYVGCFRSHCVAGHKWALIDLQRIVTAAFVEFDYRERRMHRDCHRYFPKHASNCVVLHSKIARKKRPIHCVKEETKSLDAGLAETVVIQPNLVVCFWIASTNAVWLWTW